MGLYENIKNVAKEKGISINKLEKELGFARSSISKYNSNDPGISKVMQISDFLGVSDEIFNEKLSEMNVNAENCTQLLQISNGAYTTACETAEKVIATNKNIQTEQLFVICASQALCEAVGVDEPDMMLDFKMMEFYYYLHEAVS